MNEITLIEQAIHRPDEPRHFMEYSFPESRYRVSVADVVIVDTTAALKLSEVGFHIYDPVFYFPLSDCSMDKLVETDKTSHCPLKGDTCYYDFRSGDQHIADIGWRYAKAFDFAAKLTDYIAFDQRKVAITRDS